MLEIIQIPVLNDNYIYLIHEPNSAETAVVDPAIAQPVLELLDSKGWKLNYILNTHHHNDHIGANLELKRITNCQILASKADRHRIPGIDIELIHGDRIRLGDQVSNIISTPGHTLAHIVYHFPLSNALFCGDTLFSMGCGRLFEGSAEQMWHSLQHIKKLPTETLIYCAHEYTKANAQFAISLEPNNQQIKQRIQQIEKLLANKQATIPCILEQELATNPFLREDSMELQKTLKMNEKPAIEVFAKTRKLKDNF